MLKVSFRHKEQNIIVYVEDLPEAFKLYAPLLDEEKQKVILRKMLVKMADELAIGDSIDAYYIIRRIRNMGDKEFKALIVSSNQFPSEVTFNTKLNRKIASSSVSRSPGVFEHSQSYEILKEEERLLAQKREKLFNQLEWFPVSEEEDYPEELWANYENSHKLVEQFEEAAKESFKKGGLVETTFSQAVLYEEQPEGYFDEVAAKKAFLNVGLSEARGELIARIADKKGELESFSEDITELEIALDNFIKKVSEPTKDYDAEALKAYIEEKHAEKEKITTAYFSAKKTIQDIIVENDKLPDEYQSSYMQCFSDYDRYHRQLKVFKEELYRQLFEAARNYYDAILLRTRDNEKEREAYLAIFSEKFGEIALYNEVGALSQINKEEWLSYSFDELEVKINEIVKHGTDHAECLKVLNVHLNALNTRFNEWVSEFEAEWARPASEPFIILTGQLKENYAHQNMFAKAATNIVVTSSFAFGEGAKALERFYLNHCNPFVSQVVGQAESEEGPSLLATKLLQLNNMDAERIAREMVGGAKKEFEMLKQDIESHCSYLVLLKQAESLLQLAEEKNNIIKSSSGALKEKSLQLDDGNLQKGQRAIQEKADELAKKGEAYLGKVSRLKKEIKDERDIKEIEVYIEKIKRKLVKMDQVSSTFNLLDEAISTVQTSATAITGDINAITLLLEKVRRERLALFSKEEEAHVGEKEIEQSSLLAAYDEVKAKLETIHDIIQKEENKKVSVNLQNDLLNEFNASQLFPEVLERRIGALKKRQEHLNQKRLKAERYEQVLKLLETAREGEAALSEILDYERLVESEKAIFEKEIKESKRKHASITEQSANKSFGKVKNCINEAKRLIEVVKSAALHIVKLMENEKTDLNVHLKIIEGHNEAIATQSKLIANHLEKAQERKQTALAEYKEPIKKKKKEKKKPVSVDKKTHENEVKETQQEEVYRARSGTEADITVYADGQQEQPTAAGTAKMLAQMLQDLPLWKKHVKLTFLGGGKQAVLQTDERTEKARVATGIATMINVMQVKNCYKINDQDAVDFLQAQRVVACMAMIRARRNAKYSFFKVRTTELNKFYNAFLQEGDIDNLSAVMAENKINEKNLYDENKETGKTNLDILMAALKPLDVDKIHLELDTWRDLYQPVRQFSGR